MGWMQERHNRYLNDPRWEEAKRLAEQSRFYECNDLVLQIMMDYGVITSKK